MFGRREEESGRIARGGEGPRSLVQTLRETTDRLDIQNEISAGCQLVYLGVGDVSGFGDTKTRVI